MNDIVLPRVTIHVGDCLESLRAMEAGSVHCCVTSPPYWGLRDYGTAEWEGGNPECPHRVPATGSTSNKGNNNSEGKPFSGQCRLCGARRVDRQIGLEQTPAEYVAKMVEVFREVRRVLRTDGTCWINLGDSYAGSVALTTNEKALKGKQGTSRGTHGNIGWRNIQHDSKPKDLVGIPWRVAFALQADGWVLRQEIVWSKPNPMPESVQDRCTKAHESIFLLAKAKWHGPDNGRFASISDQDARWLALLIDTEGCIVVKRCKHDGRNDTFAPQVSIGNTSEALMSEVVRVVGHGTILERPGKNKRMLYWQLGHNVARDFLHRIYPFLIAKQRQARIGIYVDALTYHRGGKTPERKNRGADESSRLESLWARCKACNHFGNPDLSDVPLPVFGRWGDCERYHFDAKAIAEASIYAGKTVRTNGDDGYETVGGPDLRTRDGFRRGVTVGDTRNKRSVWTVATQPYPEAHFATYPPKLIEPCILAGCPADGIVLDPFGGSGTTAAVAVKHGRSAVLCELNPAYAQLAERRVREQLDGVGLFVGE